MEENITVIVPVYNVERYLARCVESVLNQTYLHLQVILVDDGSTDTSGIICDSFAQKDQRVQVIHKSNGGPTSARKAGLAKAEGEYVAFVDSDDYIEPNMYEELLDCIISTGADFVYSGDIEESESQGSMTYLPEKTGVFHNFDKCEIITKYLLDRDESGIAFISLWSKLYRRQLIINCCEKVPDSIAWGEDILTICYCILESNRFAVKEGAYYHYTFRPGSLSRREGASIFAQIGDVYRHLGIAFQEYGCFSQLSEKRDNFYVRYILCYLTLWKKNQNTLYVPLYYYSNTNAIMGKKIAIYGAGKVGSDYYTQLCRYAACDIVALADTYPDNCHSEYIRVIGISELSAIEFDVVIIAVLSQNVALEIKTLLLDSGIPEEKIEWKKPERII